MPRPPETPRKRRPPYFWWLLANALALCFAVISWGVCLHVFRNMEVPRNYKILGMLGRLPVWEAYTADKAPNGAVLGPRELYRKFAGMTGEDARRWNSLLLRNYLTNSVNPQLLTYIEGTYQVRSVRALSAGDFLDPGVRVGAQALVQPDEFTPPAPFPVFIECVLPTADAGAAAGFKVGEVLDIRKSPHCASVVHVSRVQVDGDAALLLTVIPVAYGPWVSGEVARFAVTPPVELRPGAGFPVDKEVPSD